MATCGSCGRDPDYHYPNCDLVAWVEEGKVPLFVKGDPHDEWQVVLAWIRATEELIEKDILPSGIEGMYGTFCELVELVDVERFDGTQNGTYVCGTPEELLGQFPDRKKDIKKVMSEMTAIAAELANDIAKEKRQKKALKKVEEARKALEEAQREAEDFD